MLEAFRKVSKHIVFRVLFGILLLSFALSGLTGVSRMHFIGDDYRVKVGHESISQFAIDQRYDQIVRNLRRMGVDLNEEQLAAQGVSKEQILRMMIQDSLIRQEVADLGIEVGDDAVADQIKSNPAFQVDGKFDRNQFTYVIMNKGFKNEAAFTANLYNDIRNSILLASVEYNIPLNDYIAKEVAVFDNQKRDIETVIMPKELGAAGEPGEDEIKNFYAENSIQFQIPETRDVNYIKFAKKKYSDAELEALTTKIEDELAAGSSLKEVAAKLKFKTESKANLSKEGEAEFSPLFVDTAFTRDIGEGMDLVLDKDKGEYFIVEVSKLNKARIPELTEIKQKVIEAWKEEDANLRNLNYLEELVGKLKDSDESLASFAERSGYSYQVLRNVKRSDTEEYGARLVDGAFSVAEGEIIGSFQNDDGTYKIAALKKIKNEKLTPADEAKFKAGLATLAKAEVIDQYLEYLKKKFPLKEKKTQKATAAATSTDQPVPKPK